MFFMDYHHYDVVRKERRDLSEGVLPVDLMTELYRAKAEDEMLIFSLTAKAFFATCGVDKTEVIFFKPIPFMWQSVFIQWGENNKWWLKLQTWDECESFFLENVSKFDYKLPPNGAKVIHYVIG